MIDQLLLSGFEPPEHHEQCLLNTIFPQLQDAVAASGGDPALLTCKTNKDYSAVFLSTFTAFRLRFRGRQHYISLPMVFRDLIPKGMPTKLMKSDPKYIRIIVDEEHQAESYADFLVQVVGETVSRYPKEWDCCSKYMECSDAKSCIHPDKAFSLACGYRRILASGRIFYGKNRNID